MAPMSSDEEIPAMVTPSHGNSSTDDAIQAYIGPITRSRARKLHQEVSLFIFYN